MCRITRSRQADRISWCVAFLPRFGGPEYHPEQNRKIHLRIHTFESTGQVGAGGYFCLNKHVIVTFIFEGVTDCELAGFNHQNVVNGIAISNQFQSYELTLNGIFGLTGRICSKSIEIEFEVGKPAESQYRE